MLHRLAVPAFVIGSLLQAHGPARAEPPPDFELRAGEQTFRLSQQRGRFVALHFLLKTECPYCLGLVREYHSRGPSIAGVVHVFIKSDDEPEIEAFAEKLGPAPDRPAIYRDPGAKLADAFGIPGGYAFHGQTVHYPALILLDPAGKEVYRHIGRDNRDRVPFDDLAAEIARHASSPGAGEYNVKSGQAAVQGYDVVSYFDGAPRKGDARFASAYRGVGYWFADEASRRRFAADPQKYVPAYGGWCATAMAEGRKVSIDPRNYKVTNGRLYLFYKSLLADARKDWMKDESGLMQKADAAWKTIAPRDE